MRALWDIEGDSNHMKLVCGGSIGQSLALRKRKSIITAIVYNDGLRVAVLYLLFQHKCNFVLRNTEHDHRGMGLIYDKESVHKTLEL